MRSAVALLLALVAGSPAAAKELWERPWLEVTTPHFRVASALGEEETRDLAIGLENFRIVVRATTDARFEETAPTEITVVPGRAPEIGLTGDRAGFLNPAMRANYAVLRPAPGARLGAILQHEYVHFLVRNRRDLVYPTWLDEGSAKLLSTVEVKDGFATLGNANRNRMEWLSYGTWLPFLTILEADSTEPFENERGAMFYAQSWALTHYLQFGRPERRFAEDTVAYLKRVESGEAVESAFEAAYGVPVQRLRRTLIGYFAAKARYLRFELKHPFDGEQARASPLALDAIATRLGALSLQAARWEDARKAFEAALAANPRNGAAMVGLADVLEFAGRYAEAEPLYERAITLEPENALHELDYGEYFDTRARKEPDPVERQEWLRLARRHYARSYALDEEVPETLAVYGATFLVPGQPAEKGLEALAEAHAMLPSHEQIGLWYAQALAATGRRDEARAELRRLAAWSHRTLAAEAEKLLAELTDAPAPAGESGGAAD